METLTAASLETFRKYAEDAENWSGNPWVSGGNINPTKEMRGNLADLVKKGLIRIHGQDRETWISFTTEGKELASSLGITLA